MERKKTNGKITLKKTRNFILNRLGIILESAPIAIFCLVAETKGQTFRGTPGFYSTSGVVDYTAMIFCAHLVAVKCEVFTATSTREIQPCARPATQLTRSPYFRQIAYASPVRMREYLSERGLLLGHTPSRTPNTAFRHLPPNSARFGYITEGALFISAQLSSDAVSALRKVRVLIRLWKQPSAIIQELCESRGGRPGLSVLTSLLVSVDVKNY